MKRGLLKVCLGGLMLAGTWAFAGDPTNGRKIANMCRTCHGLNGFAQIPIAPHIGGEPKEYLEAQMLAFKTGTREHEIMTIVAGGLSVEQIADVAAWYASHTATATLPTDANVEDAPDACVSCHGANGISEVPDAPNLAGEVNVYIATQLKDFRSGKRQHVVMTAIASELNDDEIRDFADWYAAIELQIATGK